MSRESAHEAKRRVLDRPEPADAERVHGELEFRPDGFADVYLMAAETRRVAVLEAPCRFKRGDAPGDEG